MASKRRVQFPSRKPKNKKAAQRSNEETRKSSRSSDATQEETTDKSCPSPESQEQSVQGSTTPSLPTSSSTRPMSEPPPRTAYLEENDGYDYSPTPSLMIEEPHNSLKPTQHMSPTNDEPAASIDTIQSSHAAPAQRPLLPHTQHQTHRPLPTDAQGNIFTHALVEARHRVNPEPTRNPLAGYSRVEPDVYSPKIVQRGGFYQPEGRKSKSGQKCIEDRPGDPWQQILNKQASRSWFLRREG